MIKEAIIDALKPKDKENSEMFKLTPEQRRWPNLM